MTELERRWLNHCEKHFGPCRLVTDAHMQRVVAVNCVVERAMPEALPNSRGGFTKLRGKKE